MDNVIIRGDFVRLTDPLSEGQIVRIDNVSDDGTASWLGGVQKGDMEQIKIDEVDSDLCYGYPCLSDLIRHIEASLNVKLYPESAVEYWKRRAEIAEESLAKSKDYIKMVILKQ